MRDTSVDNNKRRAARRHGWARTVAAITRFAAAISRSGARP